MSCLRWIALAGVAGLGLLPGCASSNPCDGQGMGLGRGGLMQRLGLGQRDNCCVAAPQGPICDPCLSHGAGPALGQGPVYGQGPALPVGNGPFMPGAENLGQPRLEPQAQPLPANPTFRRP